VKGIADSFYRCTLHSDIHTVHSTTDALFIKTLTKIYIKIRWLLHVSVFDHHQRACSWAWL